MILKYHSLSCVCQSCLSNDELFGAVVDREFFNVANLTADLVVER